MESIPGNLEKQIREYYRNYYHVELGLPDWKERTERRLNEEATFAEPVLASLEVYFNLDFRGKRVLVVGAGTGAELFSLQKKGADVYGLEPYPPAVKILKIKAGFNGLEVARITEGIAESLPYEDGFFDFIYCYTVLEHVQDVEKALDEMVRVCSPGGNIFLETPNYRMPYEPHYKIFMPTFLPRSMLKLYLLLRGRPPAFINSLNFIHPGRILNYLRHKEVTCLPILHGFPQSFAKKSNYIYLLMHYFGMERDLWVMVCKPTNKEKSSGKSAI